MEVSSSYIEQNGVNRLSLLNDFQTEKSLFKRIHGPEYNPLSII